jgi:cell division protein FtsI (penicillin-binding protein 3)
MAKKVVRTKKTNLRQTVFTRFMLIVALLLIWMGGISARLVHLQVTKHEWLKEKAEDQRVDRTKSKLPRGGIFDRNGRALAMTVRVRTLYADPAEIEDIKGFAKPVAKVTGLKEKEVIAQLTSAKEGGRRFVPLAKGLEDDAVQRINKELDDPALRKADSPNFAGLHWRDEHRRSYPYKNLAAHVIGFSNADGIGQAGVEQSQNDVLFGAVVKKTRERDRLGRVYEESVTGNELPKDVFLTISAPIQFMVEQALDRAVKASQARSGMALVIDNRTGEILALANNPTFDPNNLQEITHENLSNAAVQQVYSPGSVFKLLTYGAAFERDILASPNDEIDSGNGTIEVAKHRFRDSHAIGRVTAAKAFAHSSNVCAIKTALRVGKENFYQSIQDFGFGSRTGVELPAETNGIVRKVERWNGDSLASMSIGYEIGVTALQMATAFATIANDGVRIQPHIIKEIRQSDDQVVSKAQPQQKRVVSVETARDLKVLMREVVTGGTGKRAQLEGYTSAGKTGTAWKFDEKLKKVNSAKYVSSFIGIAPADDPVVTIAVVMDEPKIGGRDGGQVAGPVFKEIAQQILPELNVQPQGGIQAMTEIEDIPEITSPAAEDNLDRMPESIFIRPEDTKAKPFDTNGSTDGTASKEDRPSGEQAPEQKQEPRPKMPVKTQVNATSLKEKDRRKT